MALADSIPGVSGGTVAYILGFYDQFLTSLNNVLSKDKLKQREALIFLAQLLSGWVVAMVLSILILSTLFTNKIYFMSSFLIGLTISSIPLIVIEEKSIFEKNVKPIIKYIVFFLIGFFLVIFISTFSASSTNNNTVLTNISFATGIRLLLAGILAISTMILPGISGSSVLVILKLYIPVINALKMIITFNFEYLFAIILFGIGILIGAVTTVKVVKYALLKHRSSTISFIVGLILAAIYSIIIGPTTLEIPQAPLSVETFSLIGFSLGVFIIISLNKFKKNKSVKPN